LYFATFLTLFSGFEYLIAAWPFLTEKEEPKYIKN
jgi:hypothetical protein